MTSPHGSLVAILSRKILAIFWKRWEEGGGEGEGEGGHSCKMGEPEDELQNKSMKVTSKNRR